jgi:NIMA (never in mitosis gene a)-related kinase
MSKTTIHSFVPIQKLGEGTFSSVYKVRRISDNKIYALKKVQKIINRSKWHR